MQRGTCDYFFRVVGVGLLDDANFTQSDLKVLRELPYIAELTLEGSHFSDESIEDLACLENLRSLDLMNTTFTNAGLTRLKQSIPQCSISHYPALE